MEQAQPDTAYGYIRHGIAAALKILSPFTRDEDQEMARTVLREDLQAPYFTCQWKGTTNATHHEATSQGARHGAVMNNYLR